MKKTLTLALLLMLLLTACAKEINLQFYVIDSCGGCAGKTDFGCKNCPIIDELSIRYKALFPDDTVNMTFGNLRFDRTQQPELEARLTEKGVDYDEVPLPVVFIDDAVFLADGSMDEAIKTYVETGVEPDIHELLREKAEYEASLKPGIVVVVYSSYCDSCAEVDKWLKYSLPIGYELVKYDIYTEEGLAMEEYYLEALNIPEEEYVLPLVIYGDYWFAGKKSIYLSLKSRIQEHPNEQTILYEQING